MKATRKQEYRKMAGPLGCRGAALLLGGLLGVSILLTGCDTSGADLNVLIPKAIDKWKGPNNVEAAGDLFNATNPDARRIAVAYISQKEWGHEPPYMKAYHVLATSDPNPMVRGQALRALGTSHQAKVADDLILGLGHPDALVREDASLAMAEITNASMVEILLDHLLIDMDRQTRINCAVALNKYPEKRVIKGLANALDDKDIAVVNNAYRSLKTLTGKDLGSDRGPWADLAAGMPDPKKETPGVGVQMGGSELEPATTRGK